MNEAKQTITVQETPPAARGEKSSPLFREDDTLHKTVTSLLAAIAAFMMNILWKDATIILTV